MIPAVTATALAAFLDDPGRVRVWIPEEDDARWDDPDDHGDPKIERWARALGEISPDVALQAAIACTNTIAIVWRVDVGTSSIDAAIAAARSHQEIDTALSQLDTDKARAHWAHTRDAWSAARCALIAARDPDRAANELRFAALFAYRVIGWSSHRVTEGERALGDQLARLPTEGTDDADRRRQTLRRCVRSALLG